MNIQLDCGELLPGHRFAVTGLRQDGLSDDAMLADVSGHRPGETSEPMVSVTYELTPGLSEDEIQAGLCVDARVEVRPAPPRTGSDADRGVPSEQDAKPGRAVTDGAFGPFRCPDETSEVVLHLRAIQVQRVAADGTVLNADAGDRLASVNRNSGQVTIDLATGTARWVPDTDTEHRP